MKPYSHKPTNNSVTFVPPPPSVPHPRYNTTGVSQYDIMTHNALIEQVLPKRGPRPVIKPNTSVSIPNEIFKVQPSLGKRKTWAVPDNESSITPDDKRPQYHAINICGSGFDGLATTIETYLNEGKLQEAIHQINTCIREREPKAKDKSHQNAIRTLHELLHQLNLYNNEPDTYNNIAEHGGFIVRYNEYIGELSQFHVIPRRNLTFITQRLSGGKYKKTHRKRKCIRTVKRYLKRKHKRIK